MIKNLIRSILLLTAIYSGAIAANSHDYSVVIPMAIECGIACGVFVKIKDDKED